DSVPDPRPRTPGASRSQAQGHPRHDRSRRQRGGRREAVAPLHDAGVVPAMSTLQRFDAKADPDDILAGIDGDGAVIVQGLLSSDVVDRVNDEVGAALDAADPDEELFNPIMQAFHG